MRNLTTTLCLTLAVLLGSAGMSVSQDFQKGLEMDDLVQREGLYYEKFTDVPFSGEVTGETGI